MADPNVLTTAEHDLVLLTAEVWNTFLQLPCEHPADQSEFCRKIHELQSMILARPARRSINQALVST